MSDTDAPMTSSKYAITQLHCDPIRYVTASVEHWHTKAPVLGQTELLHHNTLCHATLIPVEGNLADLSLNYGMLAVNPPYITRQKDVFVKFFLLNYL